MTWLIVAGFVLYVMIGFFFNGFFNITFAVDGSMFFAMLVMWPVIIAALLVAIVARTPIHIGKRLGDKYRHVVDDVLDKLYK